jgi:hypothetical protein
MINQILAHFERSENKVIKGDIIKHYELSYTDYFNRYEMDSYIESVISYDSVNIELTKDDIMKKEKRSKYVGN